VQEKFNETMKDKWSLKRENEGKRGGEWRQKVCVRSTVTTDILQEGEMRGNFLAKT
jgi:hypothetical protein